MGSLRTALYNFLFAKKYGGDLLLRIEDTDQSREVKGAVQNLLKSLSWAGLTWEEGPVLENDKSSEKGEYGPYFQSQRLEMYKKHAESLVKSGNAYFCFCPPERLEEMRSEQMSKKLPPMYDRSCRTLSQKDLQKQKTAGMPFVIRLKVPDGKQITFTDLVRGKIGFNTSTIDDQVLLKSDGFPTYHLANVVDDHLMEISHVIRGEEWLPSTPKHILLYTAFGWEAPLFAHLPLLLNPNRSKLSKRQGHVAVEEYIQEGYLPEAVINFVAFLGWNPGEGSTQEIFSFDELTRKFSFDHVHKAGAVFDIRKLNWLNAQYIKKLPLADLLTRSREYLIQKDFYIQTEEQYKTDEYLIKVLTIEQERLEKLSEVGESNQFFFTKPRYSKELLRWKNQDDADVAKMLTRARETLEDIPDNEWTCESIEKVLMDTAGDNRGEFLWPLRIALTGEKKSPPPFDCAWVLGKEESVKRISDAL